MSIRHEGQDADIRCAGYHWQLSAAVSTGRRNTCIETLCGSFISQRLSRLFVELPFESITELTMIYVLPLFGDPKVDLRSGREGNSQFLVVPMVCTIAADAATSYA